MGQILTSEQAFDMLPVVMDVYDKLDFEAYKKEVQEKYKDEPEVDREKVGKEMLRFLAKKSNIVKDEIFELAAIAQDISVEEAKKQSIGASIKVISGIFKDEELMGFFKAAI